MWEWQEQVLRLASGSKRLCRLTRRHRCTWASCEARIGVTDSNQKKKRKGKKLFPSKVELRVLTQQVSFLLYPSAPLVIWIVWTDTLVFGPLRDSLPIKEAAVDNLKVITVSSASWNKLMCTTWTVCLCWQLSGYS